MCTDKKVLRLEPFGPRQTGMQEMQLSPEDFQSEFPVQHIHVDYQDTTPGLTVGVWQTSEFIKKFYSISDPGAVLISKIIACCINSLCCTWIHGQFGEYKTNK